jgi:CRISPR system Cascade subunit CasA
VGAICAYLEKWRDRFWLFHPQTPFMQVAALATAEETKDNRKPWTHIALASACGNTPIVFDHDCDDSPIAIRSAEALAMLLGCLQFTPGGLVQTLRVRGEGGALVNTAAVLPLGENLAQTLCLCLHRAPTGNSMEDLPAWERPPLTITELRGRPVSATGTNDRYTRQSRAVLFLRENDDSIRWLRFAVGLELDKDDNAPDEMACFMKEDSKLPLSFSDGRALWRDLPALLPNVGRRPAAIMTYAINLQQENSEQPILVSGVASEIVRMKVLRWRVEQITLPSTLLVDANKANYLRDLVTLAEKLHKDLETEAVSMIVKIWPPIKDSESHVRNHLKKSSFALNYFSFAERALPRLLHLLGDDEYEKADALWCATLRSASLDAWEQLLASQGYSARALRADAIFWPRFKNVLKKHVPEPEPENSKED